MILSTRIENIFGSVVNKPKENQPTAVASLAVAGGVLCGFGLYYYYSSSSNKNKNKNKKYHPPWPIIPGALPIIGNFHQMGGLEQAGFKVLSWCTEYGSKYGVYEFNLLGNRTIVVYSKETVQQIMTMKPTLISREEMESEAVNSIGACGLFTAEGETWKSEHALVSAQLNKKNMNDYLSKMSPIINRLMDHWNEIGKNGSESVNVTTDIYNFVSDVLAITAFDKDYKFLYKPAAANFMQNLMHGIGIRAFSPFFYWKIPIIGQYLDGLGFHIDNLKRLMNELLDEYDGILKGGNSENTTSDSQRSTILGKLYSQMHSTKSTMTRERTIGNLITLFLAGTDTTGSSMLFALYFLAKDKLLQEELLKEAIDFDCETATVESMTTYLPRIKSFLHEIHRFHAASNLMARRTREEITLCGTTLPKNTTLFVATRFYSTHSSCDDVPLGPKHSPPSKFCPYRWLNEKEDGSFEVVSPGKNNFGFMAFGAGLRACPGRLYAESLQILLLVGFLKRFDSSLELGHEEMQPVSRFLDVPNCDIKLCLKSR